MWGVAVNHKPMTKAEDKQSRCAQSELSSVQKVHITKTYIIRGDGGSVRLTLCNRPPGLGAGVAVVREAAFSGQAMGNGGNATRSSGTAHALRILCGTAIPRQPQGRPSRWLDQPRRSTLSINMGFGDQRVAGKSLASHVSGVPTLFSVPGCLRLARFLLYDWWTVILQKKCG